MSRRGEEEKEEEGEGRGRKELGVPPTILKRYLFMKFLYEFPGEGHSRLPHLFHMVNSALCGDHLSLRA